MFCRANDIIKFRNAVNLPLWLIAVLLMQSCSSYEEKKAIASSTSTPASTLSALARDDDGFWRPWVASNPNTEDETLFYLARFSDSALNTIRNEHSSTRVLERARHNVRYDDRVLAIYLILEHPAVTSGLIDQIVKGNLPDRNVMDPMAQHPLASSAALDALVREDQWHGFDLGHYPLVAANPNTAPATLDYLAGGAMSADVQLISTLALRRDLPFKGQWTLAQTDFSPWVRQRLYSHGTIDEHIDRLPGESPTTWRVQLERHKSSRQTVATIEKAVAAMDRNDVIERQRLLQAVQVRRFLNDLKKDYPAIVVDFHQYIAADNVYAGDCPSIRVVVEGIWFVVQRKPGENPIEFELKGRGPGAGLSCSPNTSETPRTQYYEIALERVSDNVKRVLDGKRFESLFDTAYESVKLPEENTLMTWSQLRTRYGWEGHEGSPKLRVLAGPANMDTLTIRNRQLIPSSRITGRVRFDNVIFDGQVIFGPTGLRFGEGSRLLREWP